MLYVEVGSHLGSHSGVIGPDGNQRGADGRALGGDIEAGGSNADALGGNVDALHMDTALSLVDRPLSPACCCAGCAVLRVLRCGTLALTTAETPGGIAQWRMQAHHVSMPFGESAARSSAKHDTAVRARQCSQMASRSEDSAGALGSGAALLTVAPIPMPTGFTAMAQGETPTPVKPKLMAEAESWKRLVLDEKKVGALMATALLITWRMTKPCQCCR